MPDHIGKPTYFDCGIPALSPTLPEKLPAEKVQALRRTCKLAADILKSLKHFIQVCIIELILNETL